MPYRPSLTDSELSKVATSQAGVIARGQLLAIGYTDSMIRSNVTGRRWNRLLPGVYHTVTGTPSFRSWLWAAHLYAGTDSSLFGRTALQAWRLVPIGWPIHVAVTADRRLGPPPSGLVVHRLRENRPVGLTVGCPPASAVQYALLDAVMAATDPQAVTSLVTAVCQKRRSTAGEIELVASSKPRLRHRSLLLTLLAEIRDGATTVLEIPAMRKIFRAHGLPTGVGQVRELQDGKTVVRDRVFQDYGLVVEFDGRLGHDDPRGRMRDHRRDNAVVLSGRTTLRFGWADVYHEACEAAVQAAAVLRSRGWTGEVSRCGPGCRIRQGTT
ncbi:MAG: hypothetical protein WCP28_03465 [Actinomycetes bacterium]